MRALVVGASPVPGGEACYLALLKGADLVVACDAAAEWCVSLGRAPDVAVGDFDSAEAGAQGRLSALGVPVRAFPAEKDLSDLDLAVAEARSRGATRLTITAASSRRLDHTLVALGALLRCVDLHAAVEEPDLAAWALDADVRRRLGLRGPAGALVSVFAIDEALGVTLSGLRYPLVRATLEPLDSLCLSNELLAGAASVSVVKGRLLVLSPGEPGTRAILAED
jgi:thiamine pyrophosphokinase